MENYESEPSHIEHTVDKHPFVDPQYYLLEVPKEIKIKTMVRKGLQNLGPGKPIVLCAEGNATSKAVSCTEIIKTYYKSNVHQITWLGQIKTVETWLPVADGLDPLRVTRSVPIIYILLSLEKLDENCSGYQKSSRRKREEKLTLAMSELYSAIDETQIASSPLSPSPSISISSPKESRPPTSST